MRSTWTMMTICVGARLGHPLTEAAAQVDDRHDHTAQVEDAAHVVGLIGKMRDVRSSP